MKMQRVTFGYDSYVEKVIKLGGGAYLQAVVMLDGKVELILYLSLN